MFRLTGGHWGKHVNQQHMDVNVRLCSLFWCSVLLVQCEQTKHQREEMLLWPPHTCSLPMATRQYFPV